MAALLGLAAALALQSLSPTPPATSMVLVAAADLPAGHVLVTGDLRTARWPAGEQPAGAITPPAAGRLASPLRRGEPLTDARLVGPGVLRGLPPGSLAVPVPVGDLAALTGVQVGDRVDVLVGPADDGLGQPVTASTAPPGSDAAADPLSAPEHPSAEQLPSAQPVGLGLLVLAVPAPPADSGWSDAVVGPAAGAADQPGVLLLAADAATARLIAAVAGARPLSVAIHAREP